LKLNKEWLPLQTCYSKNPMWRVMSRKVTEKEQTLAFSIDPDLVKFQGPLGIGESYISDPEG
jgi:hypothetical protein